MAFVRQWWLLLLINLAGMSRRAGLVATIVIGVACAVGVLVSMLAMGVGARREAMINIRADRVIMMSTGARGPMDSHIPRDAAALISNLPGIRRTSKGEPIAVPEILVFMQARKRADNGRLGFSVMGVGSRLKEYMPELHLTAGRMFTPGLRELVTSNKCVRQFIGFSVGDQRRIRGREWPVVGNVDLGGAEGNCLVFADADTVLSEFGRNTYNLIDVMLDSGSDFSTLAGALRSNASLHVEAKHEAELAQESMKVFNGVLDYVSYFVSSILALAATIGATNSLYAGVDSRRRELATLRAIGFASGPIVASILAESVLLALPGALFGSALAWAFFDGFSASPFGFTFQLAVTPKLVAIGIGWSLLMGLIGGLVPAVSASRVEVTAGLRAT